MLKKTCLAKFLAACLFGIIVEAGDMSSARPAIKSLYRQCPNIHAYNSLSVRYTPAIQRNWYSQKMDSSAEMDSLVSFWFNRDVNDWFMPPTGLDDEIRSRYLDLITQARSGNLDHWTDEPKGVLCLVLLLDQFPRNIFRGSGESFSSDAKALDIVTRAITKGYDEQLGEVSKLQQYIFYMPLMHAESLLGQIASVALFKNLANSCDKNDPARQSVSNAIEFAQKHLDCIAKHGRFPKRNEPLGRPHTEKEIEYLKDHPDGLG